MATLYKLVATRSIIVLSFKCPINSIIAWQLSYSDINNQLLFSALPLCIYIRYHLLIIFQIKDIRGLLLRNMATNTCIRLW